MPEKISLFADLQCGYMLYEALRSKISMAYSGSSRYEISPGDQGDAPRGELAHTLRTVRSSSDGIPQFVEVYFAPDPCSEEVCVTGIGPALKKTDVADLRELIGKKFASRAELVRTLDRGKEA